MSSVEEKRSSLVLGRDEKHQNSSSQVRMKFSLKHTIVIVMFHGFSPAGSCNISPKRSPVTLSCWMHRGETTSTSNRKDTMNGTSISVNLKSFMDVSLHSFLHVFKCTSFTNLKKKIYFGYRGSTTSVFSVYPADTSRRRSPGAAVLGRRKENHVRDQLGKTRDVTSYNLRAIAI